MVRGSGFAGGGGQGPVLLLLPSKSVNRETGLGEVGEVEARR